MDAKSIYKGHADEAPGEFRIRRCGCYWEYCNGCCNSCDKSKFYTSDHTTMLETGPYVSDSTAPKAYLGSTVPSGYLDPGYPYRNLNSTSEYNHR